MQNAFGMDNLAVTWPISINPIFEKSGDRLLDHLIFKETQTEDTFGPDRPFATFTVLFERHERNIIIESKKYFSFEVTKAS